MRVRTPEFVSEHLRARDWLLICRESNTRFKCHLASGMSNIIMVIERERSSSAFSYIFMGYAGESLIVPEN